MAKETKRITSMVSHQDYELLQLMFGTGSDSAMAGNFISEMANIIKIELDGLKTFSKEQVDELLKAVQEKELSFNSVQPKYSFLYILKDYYKFESKTRANRKLIEKINKLNHLQVVILARFLLTITANITKNGEIDQEQAYHFFLQENEEEIKIITKVICVKDKDELAGKLASVDQILESLPNGTHADSRIIVVDKKNVPEGEEFDIDVVTEICKPIDKGEEDEEN